MADLTGPNPDEINGDVAHDDVDAGNPVKIGGAASSGIPSGVAPGDRVAAAFDTYGLQLIAATNIKAGADAVSNNGLQSMLPLGNGQAEGPLTIAPHVFNGSTWDRVRSGGVTGMQGIAGATVADLALAANPVTIGGRASTAVPTAVSADGDVVNARFLRTGEQVVHVVDSAGAAQTFGGGTQYTEGDTDASITGTALLWEDAADTLVAASASKPLPVITPNRTASGTLGALNDVVTISADGVSWVSWHFDSSNLLGTVVFEGTANGTDWVGIYPSDGTGTEISDRVNPADSETNIAYVIPWTTVRVRVSAYTSGSATVLGIASDGVAGNVTPPQRVVIAATMSVNVTNAVAVTNAGTFAVQDATARASLSVLDDWDESDRAKVNPIVGQAGIEGGAGASTVKTQRVAIATDANAISGTVTAANTAGDTAHDAVDSGNPIKIGGYASTNPPTAVAVGDRVNAWYWPNGNQAVTLVSDAGVKVGISANIASDALSLANAPLATAPANLLFNGTNWDRVRSEAGTTGFLGVGGSVAHDAVDAGNPVKIGGYASTAAPSPVTAGDRVNAWFSRTGVQSVSPYDSLGASSGDGVSNANAMLQVRTLDDQIPSMKTEAWGKVFNGTTWDRMRGDTTGLWVHGPTVSDLAIAAAPLTIGGRASTAVPTAVSADGDVVDARYLRTGAQVVHVVDAAGAAQTFGGGTQYVEDVAFGGNGTGTLMVARRTDTPATITPIVDDAVGLRVNSLGALWVDGGLVAHDAVDAGNPVKIGGKANSSYPTPVAGGDRVDLNMDTYGTLLATPYSTGAAATLDGAADGVTPAYARNSASVIALKHLAYGVMFNGTSWDRMRTVAALDAAPNVDTGILAAGIGPGWDRKQNPTGIAATSTANAVTVVVDGADTIAFHVTTIGTTPGSMILETTNDDGAWVTAGFVLKLGSGPDTRIEGSFVPAVNDVYMVRTTGHRQVRYRVNAVYASGTATVKVTGSVGTPMIKAVDMGPPPHNIGYDLASAGAQYTSAQTSTTIGPTVSSTQRMVVTYVQIQAGGTVAATQCSVYFGTGAFSRGTSKAVFDGEFAPSATLKPGVVIAPPVPFMGAADEELKITSVGAANPLTVTIWYYLVTA